MNGVRPSGVSPSESSKGPVFESAKGSLQGHKVTVFKNFMSKVGEAFRFIFLDKKESPKPPSQQELFDHFLQNHIGGVVLMGGSPELNRLVQMGKEGLQKSLEEAGKDVEKSVVDLAGHIFPSTFKRYEDTQKKIANLSLAVSYARKAGVQVEDSLMTQIHGVKDLLEEVLIPIAKKRDSWQERLDKSNKITSEDYRQIIDECRKTMAVYGARLLSLQKAKTCPQVVLDVLTVQMGKLQDFLDKMKAREKEDFPPTLPVPENDPTPPASPSDESLPLFPRKKRKV